MPKERKKVLCMDAQRHAEYYGMQQTFDELYAKSKAGEVFNGLMELVKVFERNGFSVPLSGEA